MAKKNIENKFRAGDWISIPHTVEPEMYLRLEDSNIDYYNKIKRESIGSGPNKVGELEVKKYYEQKINEHREEASFANMLVETYRYKLLDIEDDEK
ncbi:MAG: hypothetical protein PF542_00895 [Nanoarchaeota archaeon]|jgi:hypothetical protein|nr:hypothetical protein [Nanoarchaeota archaeon]